MFFFSLFPPLLWRRWWVGGLCWWWCESRRSQPDQRRHICSLRLRYHHPPPPDTSSPPFLPLPKTKNKTNKHCHSNPPLPPPRGQCIPYQGWPHQPLHKHAHTQSHTAASQSLCPGEVCFWFFCFFFLFCLFFSLLGFSSFIVGERERTFSLCVFVFF